MKGISKICLLVIFVSGMLTSILFADAEEDLRVIYGLYQDSNYNLALDEIQRFRNFYPDNQYMPALSTLEGSIALHRQKYVLADSIFNTVDLTKLDETAQSELLLGRIQSKYYLGDYSTSTLLASQYIQRYPKSQDYWQAIYWSARLQIHYQKYADAIKSLQMIQNRPEQTLIGSSLVEAYARNGQLNESETYLKKMILDAPADAYTRQAFVIQLQALYEQGDYDSLLTYLDYSIPQSSIYYHDYALTLAKVCYALHNYHASLDYLDKVKPESEETKFYKGLNYYQLNQDSKAKIIFTDLANNAQDDQVRSNSFLQNQILVYEKDPQAAIFNLEWYIQNHPKDPLLGAYYFQVGYSHYLQGKYNLAFSKLTKAISYRLDNVTEDKTYFLMGDIYYLTDDKVAAEQSFLDYLRLMPNGSYKDEVLSKLGFIFYDKKDLDKARYYFQQILDQYQNSPKLAISYFYMGEINYYKSNYSAAKSSYVQSLKGKLDTDYIWLRICQCDYFNEDYRSALSGLKNIPEKKELLFDKYLLKGNIFFNQNDYDKALEAYSIAEKHYQTKAEWEQVISQEGLAYYLLRRFPEATAIYKQLSKEASSSDKFLLLAANSAFSAQDYQQSSYLYNLFIKTYPDSPNRDKALLGIADSHYNLGNYGLSVSEYIDIIRIYENGRLIDDALKALNWSLRLAKDQDFTLALTNLENNLQNQNLKQSIKRIHLDYVRSMKEWNKTIRIADDLIAESPSDVKLQTVKAEAFANLKRYTEADSVFKKFKTEDLSPEIYLAWSSIDMIKGDSLAALGKLKISSKKSYDPTIWLPLLALQDKLGDPDFNDYYQDFIASKPGVAADSADLIWCRWGIRQQRYDEVKSKLTNLLKSNDRQTRGTADFLDSKLSFIRGNYTEAIPELARIKYLYPEMTDNVIESQYLLCISYIRTKDPETAITIYNTIRNSLSSYQVSNVERELSSGGSE